MQVTVQASRRAWTAGEKVRVRVRFTGPPQPYTPDTPPEERLNWDKVDVAGGTPTIRLLLGDRERRTRARTASYVSGSGTNTLVFEYEVTAGDGRVGAVEVEPDSLASNGATIRNVPGLDAELGHLGAVQYAQRPALSVADAEATEGEDATLDFVVKLDGNSGSEVKVAYHTRDGTAEAGSDYTETRGRLTFDPGEYEKTVSVPIGDDAVHDDGETFKLLLGNVSGAGVANDDYEAVGTIREPPPTCPENADDVWCGVITVEERRGHYGYNSFYDQGELSDNDFDVGTNSYTFSYFSVEALNGNISFKLVERPNAAEQDALDELTLYLDNDAFKLSESRDNPPGLYYWVADLDWSSEGYILARLGDASSGNSQRGEESSPALSVADAEATEGEDETLDFLVRLDGNPGSDVTVDYGTRDRTATAGSDYTETSGTLTFEPGEDEQTVSVPITDDDGEDDGETFTLVLSNVSGAGVANNDYEAVGTIRNDESEAPSGGLTARFARVPAEHNGKAAFTLRIAFSETIRMSGQRLRDDVVAVTGGRATKAKPVNGRKDRWDLTVKPDSLADVTVTLAGGAACDTPDAVCTADGQALSNTISATVGGPVTVSVADARAREGKDATIDFAVTLSRAGAASVTYATADGTATAGSDYKVRQGKLRFAAGETEKTISVPVLDDAHDEGAETLRLRLLVASGATIADGVATGTIENSDPIPQAWLARFGRAVAGQVTDAIAGRLTGPADDGSHVTLGGQRLSLDGHAPEVPDATGPEAADGLTAFADRIAAHADGGARQRQAPGAVRSLTGRELLLGSSFRLALGGGDAGNAGTSWTAWGRAAQSRFDGDADGLALDGDVTTFTLGADAAWSRWLAGVALAHSTGGGGYRDHAPGDGHAGRGAGTLETTLTSVHPYARYRAGERLTVWGMLGYGAGDLTLTMKGRDGAADTRIDTGTGSRMAAAGTRGVLVAAGDTGGFELAARTDAQFVRITSEKTDGLAATTADTSRLRLVLEGSHRFELAGGQTLTPSLEVGLRHDGGDAETGAGIEVGGGVRYANPALGLTAEAKARGLVAHDDSDYSEWGASGSVRIDPGTSGRGLSLTLTPAWGAASDGADRLWSLRDARQFAANAAFDPTAHLDAQTGYGFGAFGGRGLMTPYAGLALSETGARAWRTGVRWTLGPGVAFGVEGTRGEPANDDPPEHGFAFRAMLRW